MVVTYFNNPLRIFRPPMHNPHMARILRILGTFQEEEIRLFPESLDYWADYLLPFMDVGGINVDIGCDDTAVVAFSVSLIRVCHVD